MPRAVSGLAGGRGSRGCAGHLWRLRDRGQGGDARPRRRAHLLALPRHRRQRRASRRLHAHGRAQAGAAGRLAALRRCRAALHITHTRARARTHRERTLSLFGPGVGLCGITITQTALVLALQYVPAFNASLMQPSQPVLTLLLALCLRLEKLRLRSVSGALKLAGVLIGCAGAANRLEAKRRLGSATAQRPWPPGAGAPGSRLRYAPGPDRRTAQGPIAQSPNRPIAQWGGCGAAVRPGPSRQFCGVPLNAQEPHTRC